MSKFITPVDAAIFTGILGIVMVLTGREIGGAIVIAASLGAFIFFDWWLHHHLPNNPPGKFKLTNRIIRKHNKAFPDDPIPLNETFLQRLFKRL